MNKYVIEHPNLSSALLACRSAFGHPADIAATEPYRMAISHSPIENGREKIKMKHFRASVAVRPPQSQIKQYKFDTKMEIEEEENNGDDDDDNKKNHSNCLFAVRGVIVQYFK